ncbi:hypothetical protein [Labilibaculum sp.]|uniref:hypothetical protein n=1 Tax=Labilibaculum sp. TaxID=2060723 RepID=UPI002AA8739C|nr:hypothetical protein [Labilibaculum sp.]
MNKTEKVCSKNDQNKRERSGFSAWLFLSRQKDGSFAWQKGRPNKKLSYFSGK